MLELVNVRKSFGGKAVIESASLSVKAGEILCLTGPSGIGKSTLLEIMAGVTRPDAGSVNRSAKPALMFQDDVLIPWLTAHEAIRYILPPSLSPRLSKDVKNERASLWLNKFELAENDYPAAMSGGMRRRLSLARTFAAARPLILLDEPFAFLDEARCRTVAEEMAKHALAGGCIVLTSHTAAPLGSAVFSKVPVRFAEVAHTPVILTLP